MEQIKKAATEKKVVVHTGMAVNMEAAETLVGSIDEANMPAFCKALKGSYKNFKATFNVTPDAMLGAIQLLAEAGTLKITPSHGSANTRLAYIKGVKATMTPEAKQAWIDGVEKNFHNAGSRIDVIELNKA
jgi:hypothetical protein